jgi:hypothetical protein
MTENEAIDEIDVISIQISHNFLQRNSFVFFGGGKLTARRRRGRQQRIPQTLQPYN